MRLLVKILDVLRQDGSEASISNALRQSIRRVRARVTDADPEEKGDKSQDQVDTGKKIDLATKRRIVRSGERQDIESLGEYDRLAVIWSICTGLPCRFAIDETGNAYPGSAKPAKIEQIRPSSSIQRSALFHRTMRIMVLPRPHPFGLIS